MDLTRTAALKPCGIEFSFAVVIVLKDNEDLIKCNCGFENSFRWFQCKSAAYIVAGVEADVLGSFI